MNKSKEYQDLVPLVDQQQFKQVIGHFASGVSIITVSNNGVDFGITASAVCSVSVDPPMLLVCVNKSTGTCHAISAAESFTVNIVNETQKELALRFARANTDKFDGVDFSYGELGNPVLGQTLATLECRVVEEITGGTHSVFLGEVQKADAADGDPLVYYRGKFGKFEEA
ncbi:flavin reductase family protein [Bacillus sp. ISL-7]|uniref:flavin reductase family protein n=1 Tax=Bacillus sp. ISL-7 TaxID=2819136 RepID=UPI001BEAB40F|nr:flavin reductase family protein [Bacillus sp. ISL-7]MBT2736998.1 flavin reductase family protein [Bacillus sp. ISL-7]